jgi:hypothetical protein
VAGFRSMMGPCEIIIHVWRFYPSFKNGPHPPT